MVKIEETVIREAETQDPEHYRRRVGHLALVYTGMFVLSLAGIVLLVSRGKLFVTLTQRSNVETLSLAFILVFFVYLVAISSRGTFGASRLAYYTALRWLGHDASEIELRKMNALQGEPSSTPHVALNVALEREDQPGEPFRLHIADDVALVGWLEVDGVEIKHHSTIKDGSNSLLAFFQQQVGKVLRERGVAAEVEIVAWRSTDDEATLEYAGLARFARNLERHLKADELWPKLRLTQADCDELERRLAAICPALRDEAFLPHWEFSAEHKLPIVPEPLGLISLSRSERRVDPVASMGCAVFVVAAVLAILSLFVFLPPWVPGS
ncbi:MAG: hypothetical protein HY329_16175 [Chloroflexi bacterium]|nr:hypothetical protein [Chloroflexota bacterium]